MSEELGLTPASLEEIAAEVARARRTSRKLRQQACQAYAAIDGWMGMDTPQAWWRTCKKAS